jgi:hypothetical protein
MGSKWSRALVLLLHKENWDSSKAWSWKSSKNGSDTALPNVKQTQVINQQNATNMYLMNAQNERRSVFENFGARITGFGVVVEKIWNFEVSRLFLWIFLRLGTLL